MRRRRRRRRRRRGFWHKIMARHTATRLTSVIANVLPWNIAMSEQSDKLWQLILNHLSLAFGIVFVLSVLLVKQLSSFSRA